jgi:hypothetical protein
MTGLDYEAAAIAFAGVRSSQTFTPQQDDHLELLIEVLAKNGTAKVADLYESPFTLRARGPRICSQMHRSMPSRRSCRTFEFASRCSLPPSETRRARSVAESDLG